MIAAASSNQMALRSAAIAATSSNAIAQRSKDVTARGWRAQNATTANADAKSPAVSFSTVGACHSCTKCVSGELTSINL